MNVKELENSKICLRCTECNHILALELVDKSIALLSLKATKNKAECVNCGKLNDIPLNWTEIPLIVTSK